MKYLFELRTYIHMHLLSQINVSEIVREMRLQRHGMIQTKVSESSYKLLSQMYKITLWFTI